MTFSYHQENQHTPIKFKNNWQTYILADQRDLPGFDGNTCARLVNRKPHRINRPYDELFKGENYKNLKEVTEKIIKTVETMEKT